MASVHFKTSLQATSRFSLLKPSTSTSRLFFSKNYGQACNGNRSRLMEERAPSTAEEFQRVAEEKAKEAKERVVVQNVDKSHEGTIGDSKVESNKTRYT